MHGGGLQERDERIAFYANHDFGYIARPRHDSSPGDFGHAGFEKNEEEGASDVCLQDRALRMAIDETYQVSGRKWKP